MNFINHQRLLPLLIDACSSARSLKATKVLHAFITKIGSTPDQIIFLNNNILKQYGALGELWAARNLLDRMPQRNVVSFNTMISSYSQCEFVDEAWNMFSKMRDDGLGATQFTFGGLLSCDSLSLSQGVRLQALTLKNGLFDADAFVGTALLGLYGRHGLLKEAIRVFDDVPLKSLVTWNSLLSLLGRNGLTEDCMHVFRQLMYREASLSAYSFVGVLSGFSSDKDLEIGEQIHGLVIKRGFSNEILVGNSLMNMYIKCENTCLAEIVFNEACAMDVVTWNTIIGGMAKNDRPRKALELLFKMSSCGMSPNQTTFANVIKACSSFQSPIYGKFIHAKVIRNALEADVFVGSSLVGFYAKFDELESAHCCFDEIHEKNVVSWNSLIFGYSSNCFSSTCLCLLQDMLHRGYQPNEFTFVAVLNSVMVEELQQLHCLILRMGYGNNEFVSTSLVTSYAKNGRVLDAIAFVTDSEHQSLTVLYNSIAGTYNRFGRHEETLSLLSLLEECDIVSWNILITACARKNYYTEVFELFKHMRVASIDPDNYTFVSLLSTCARLCSLVLGCSVHCLMIKYDFSCVDTFVCNVLIDMYGKCGDAASSVRIFNLVENKNLITWTALISSLGAGGYAREAIEKFREMESLGYKPDGVAFLSVLSACRYGGLVREGIALFKRIRESYGVEPEMDHYHCLVDLLTRSGHAREAEKVIAAMPFPPGAHIWRSFLGSCKMEMIVEDKEQAVIGTHLF